MKTAIRTGIGVAVVVVLLGASYAGATAWSGQRAETEVFAQVAKVQAQYPFLKVSAQSYQRGLFRSTSTMTLQVGCATDGKPPVTATVTNVIHHGPIVGGSLAAAVIDSELHLGKDTGTPPLTAHTVVGIKGAYRSTLQSLPVKVAGPNGGELAWEGLDAEADGDASLNRVAYRVKSPGLTITDPSAAMTIHVGALDVQADTTAVSATSGLRVGKLRGSIDRVSMVATMPSAGGDAKPTTLSFDKLQFADDITVTGDLLGGTVTFSGGGTFGDVKVDRVEMQMSLKNWHAPTYQHMMDTVAKSSYGCVAPTPDAAARMMVPMQADMIAMLQYNPELSVDKLAVDYGGKRGEFSYTLGMRGVTKADAAQPPTALAMAHAYAKASARLPVLWLTQLAAAAAAKMPPGSVPEPEVLAALIDEFAQQGYLVRDGEDVKTSAELNNGAITVNGKPVGGPPR